MQLMRPLAGICCQGIGTNNQAPWSPSPPLQHLGSRSDSSFEERTNYDDEDEDQEILTSYHKVFEDYSNKSRPAVSPLVVAPMLSNTAALSLTTEQILHEYVAACQLYHVKPNSGVLATFRFHLPSMRVAGPFHDTEMLALTEILLRYINGPLSYIRRLDFSRSSKEGKLHGKKGFRSHGALCLAKVLQAAKCVQEVKLQRNRIGPFGASAIFVAAAENKGLHTLVMRRCRIGERGAVAFAELVCPSVDTGLRDVDLSANQMGFRGSLAIEHALQKRDDATQPFISVDIEGNLVFQEVSKTKRSLAVDDFLFLPFTRLCPHQLVGNANENE